MGSFTVGNVVLVPFPYSDLSKFKVRPALVAGTAEFDNLILCQITSKPYSSRKAIKLTRRNFNQGSLDIDSYIRPDKLFTIEKSIITRQIGTVAPKPLEKIKSEIRKLFE